MGRHSTAVKLLERARAERTRLGEPSPADDFTTGKQWAQFEQNMAVISYIDAANTPEERAVLQSYMAF